MDELSTRAPQQSEARRTPSFVTGVVIGALLAVLVGAGAAYAGYLVWKGPLLPVPQLVNTNSKVSTAGGSSQEEKATFVSEKFGVSFQYPKNLEIIKVREGNDEFNVYEMWSLSANPPINFFFGRRATGGACIEYGPGLEREIIVDGKTVVMSILEGGQESPYDTYCIDVNLGRVFFPDNGEDIPGRYDGISVYATKAQLDNSLSLLESVLSTLRYSSKP